MKGRRSLIQRSQCTLRKVLNNLRDVKRQYSTRSDLLSQDG
ncbi:hypothetical protein HMPREF1608_04969 [Escherichia coli 908525]|nr:two-component system QseEF-associated lipoprotein QseG [Escherichia coli]EFJ56520.1 hypothetical protein HMPREF9549_02032 [Escherichia coli MS 185-1]EFJ81273.1 hypothetical protein HMPREF9534_02692 [Escherichia coli MS 69-1]EFJ90611.1 hypothetical protein HMPREF9531_04350 [Escherichia coli MS 45-1]EFK15324.1 hypothetical protein HMPREF9541_02314 [Escherichia coli MS 116-1]ESA71090.1 hypothetical protein HMPREF1588_03242 [Escherichia coli 110957]ESD24405.1 hypothetical protein HMPREF1600_03